MVLRATVSWLAILVLAILNGAARETLITPRTGPQFGHVISTIVLGALVACAAWLTVPWIAPATRGQALMIGIWWTSLTLGFEFLAGHYIFGDSWEKLRSEYDIARGRIWILIPLLTLVAPVWAYILRASWRT